MGILSSCQGMDNRMSISLDNNIFRDQSIPRYSHQDFYFQQSKLALFGDIFYKKTLSKTQFVLQTNHLNRNSQVLHIQLKIFNDSRSFVQQKGKKLCLSQYLSDPNDPQSQLYLMKYLSNPSQQLILKTIPFNKFQEEKFKKGIYQIYMLQNNLKQQNSRFAYIFKEGFVVESGVDKDTNDKCLVIIGEKATATLAEIILFRKMMQITWTQNSFEALCYQLIKGLQQLHNNGIAHRDIRPHNIFYCNSKKGFVIGGLHNAINLDKKQMAPNVGYNLSGVPYYMPRYLVTIGKRQHFSEYYNYDPFKNDIYSLGLTLLNALFLDMFMPVQVLLASLKKYKQKYSYLHILQQMIGQNPPSLQQLLQILPKNSFELDQRSNIQSLRYKMKPQDQQFVNKKKKISNGYYQMFMYDQWVEEINQVVNYYQLNNDFIQLAHAYKQIAQIYHEHHQDQMMNQYYSKASQIFLKISTDCLDQKKIPQAIKYLQKGIQCNRKGYQGAPNSDLANLLNKLAMAHHVKAEYQIARAFQQQALQITSKVHTDKSLQFALMLIDSAKIQSDFQQFKLAQNMLKAANKITQKGQQTTQVLRVKAKVLESLGNNYRMKAIQRRDKCDLYRSKAQQCLLDALKIIQQLQGSIHPQVGSILMSLGNVYFDKREFDQSRKSYQKSLIVKQHTLKGRFNVQVGQCLTYLANSQKCLKQFDKAIQHYDQAIEVFRKTYGNDHNQNTAVAIGNLGLVYKQLGRRNQQKEYLSLAKSILKDLYGEECPDYQYFDRQMAR